MMEKPLDENVNRQIDSNIQKWGSIAAFVLAIAFFVPGSIYLVGNLRTAIGPFAYHLADFLYGPVWSVSLITMIFALREKIGNHAPRRMSLALLSGFISAGMMVAVAFIRSSNRQYHILHPELNLQDSVPVLLIWGTLITGLTSVGWHFLGWAQILIGSANYGLHQMPRQLSLLYFAAGIVSLFVYLFPVAEGLGILLGMVIGIWQGVLLWKANSN